MQHNAIKRAGKKILLSSTALVLALNSLAVITPLFLSQKTSAVAEPLIAETSCTSSGVLLTLTATNILGKDALIWFHTPYGSSSEHGFAKDSTKVWTKNTGQATIPAGSVSADTVYFIGNRTFTANYGAVSCIPSAPTITSPEVVTNSSATLTWGHPDPATIASYEYREYTNLADANADTNYTSTHVAAPATSITTVPATPTDTTLYWRVIAKNIHGFVSPPSTIGSIIIDRTKPTATVHTSHGLYGGSQGKVVVTGTSNEPNSKFDFTISDGDDVVKDASPAGNTNPTWEIDNINDPNIYPSDVYKINLTVADVAGNISAAVVMPISVDNDAPTVHIKPIAKTVIGKPVKPAVTANDPSGIRSYSWRADNPAYDRLISDPSAKEPTFNPSEFGTYTFYLTVTDVLDNATEEIPFEFKWASTAPFHNSQILNLGSTYTPPTNSEATTLPQFTSTRPQVLGTITATQESEQNTGKTKSLSTQNKNKEREMITPASSGFEWYWLLFIIAILVAIYYAYRNWKLSKENQ